MEDIMRAAAAIGMPEPDKRKLQDELERDLGERLAALDADREGAGCPNCEGVLVLDDRPLTCAACGAGIKYATVVEPEQ